MTELETRIDDMENQSSRLYHLNYPAEYNEYIQVKKVFDNYYIVVNTYLAQPASMISTVPAPDESTGAIPKVTKTKKEENQEDDKDRAPTPRQGTTPCTEERGPEQTKKPRPEKETNHHRETPRNEKEEKVHHQLYPTSASED